MDSRTWSAVEQQPISQNEHAQLPASALTLRANPGGERLHPFQGPGWGEVSEALSQAHDLKGQTTE